MPVDLVASHHSLTLGRGSDAAATLDDAGTTIVTRGLAELGHPELALVLFRSPAAFPDGAQAGAAQQQMEQFLRSVVRAITDGARLEPGTTMSLNPGLVGTALRGIAWVDSAPLALHDSVPAGALVGVPLHADELRVAQRTSPHRLLTRLGRVWREFPFVPWIDPLRESVAHASGEEESALHQLPRMRCDATFLVELAQAGAPLAVRHLRLTVRARERERVAQSFREIKAEGPFPYAIVGAPSPEADAWMSWEPGQDGLHAIQRPNRELVRLSGAYLGVVPDATVTASRALPAQDGYLLFPAGAAWGRLRDALVRGEPIVLPLEAGTFELAWT